MRIGWKVPTLVAGAFALGTFGGITYAKQEKPAYVLVPAGQAKFGPLDPTNPKGAQFGVISGDPKVGPVAGLLKLPKGAAPVHWHSSDYYAVTVEGTTRHWLPGKESDPTAKGSGPGQAWFQPGGSAATAHGDECLTDSCLVFVVMNGKFDFTPAAPATPAKK
jgi:hypothetical protein